MNKYFQIFTIIFLASFQVLAQRDITVLFNTSEVGKDFLTGEIIKSNEYTFTERIQDFQIDTVNRIITFQLRGLSNNGKWLDNNGEIIRYDIESKSVLWSQWIAYQMESIEQYGGVTLYTKAGKTFCLDNRTGQQIWRVKNSIIFANPIKNIGIGYKIQILKNNDNILEGIDLTNGKPIWQRDISREYGWNKVAYLNDSTLLIGAAGLHTLNIFNGTGWDYN